MFDGTDPGHIKGDGAVNLDPAAPFEFFMNWTERDWTAAGDRQELPFDRAQAAAATSPGAEPRAVP